MSQLTDDDVDRCRRTWKAFDELYEKEMRQGLRDGKLTVKQYEALKNKNDSFRIYRTARQRRATDVRKEKNVGEPGLVTTKITDEVYNEWMDEVKQEEREKLREDRRLAQEKKVVRLQESETRKHYSGQKSWIFSKIIALSPDYHHFAVGVQAAIQISDREKIDANNIHVSEQIRSKLQEKFAHIAKHIIHIEKATRHFFDIMVMWAAKKEKRLRQAEEAFKKSVQVAAPDVITTTVADANQGDIKIAVQSQEGFSIGMFVVIGQDGTEEVQVLKSFGSLLFENPLLHPHSVDSPVKGYLPSSFTTKQLKHRKSSFALLPDDDVSIVTGTSKNTSFYQNHHNDGKGDEGYHQHHEVTNAVTKEFLFNFLDTAFRQWREELEHAERKKKKIEELRVAHDAKKREEARVYALNVAAGIVKETFDVKDLEATKGLNVNEDVSEFRDADDWSLGSLTIDTDISSLHRGEADLNQSEMTVS